jgi:hypothetical protein
VRYDQVLGQPLLGRDDVLANTQMRSPGAAMVRSNPASIADAISAKVGVLMQSRGFKDWADNERLQAGDLVIVNNSFLFREGIGSTTKSSLYIGLRVDGGDPLLPPCVVTSRRGINMSLKRVASRTASSYSTSALEDAVGEGLDGLGKIVFALVGTVGERETAQVATAGIGEFDHLRFDPTQAQPVFFDGPTLSIRQLDGVDELWAEVERLAANDEVELGADAAASSDAAFMALQEEAGRPVDINAVIEDGPSILTEVLARVDDQVAGFKSALEGHQRDPDDNEVLSELLRISYNFADGVKPLLRLTVGLSDLKPILFWLTVLEQSQLADRFAALPFSLVGKAKPSIDRYRSVIAGARNRAFHDLFAFGRPFHVALSGDAIRAPELRLFREHSRRRAALNFEDRELVDLLEEFTRSQERPVPSGFWEQNHEVMGAVAALGHAMKRALVLCHDATQGA